MYPPFFINDWVSRLRVAEIGYPNGKFAEVPYPDLIFKKLITSLLIYGNAEVGTNEADADG